ncbi:hypothetical protein A1356_20165 [Methylomonas koyamae]|uniref:Uncharacterized protein n=1 Tax=Methylomonas koyamae TaxID=702114 RepID=A0AA91D9F7_9GAMM|nr:hypothetical protein A1356_20165 [Methylomonas koyamae]
MKQKSPALASAGRFIAGIRSGRVRRARFGLPICSCSLQPAVSLLSAAAAAKLSRSRPASSHFSIPGRRRRRRAVIVARRTRPDTGAVW